MTLTRRAALGNHEEGSQLRTLRRSPHEIQCGIAGKRRRAIGGSHVFSCDGRFARAYFLTLPLLGFTVPPLFRYFSASNAKSFVERGEVLFRSLSYFRDYEDEGVRADEYEGTLVHRPEDGLKVRMVASGEEVPLPYTLESTARENDIFIYCMSTERSPIIAKRFKADVCVEILEPLKFLALVRRALGLRARLRAEKLVHHPVKYYQQHEPPIVDWALPERIAMRKPKEFEWQREYRIAVPKGAAFAVENVQVKLVPLGQRRQARAADHPRIKLKLGSLSKICRVHQC